MTEVSCSQGSLDQAYDLVDDFLDSLIVERNLSERTVAAYGSDLEAYLRWCDANDVDPLDSVHGDVRRYLAYLTAASYARSTINRHLSSVKAFYRWLTITGTQVTDPASVMRGPKLTDRLPRVMKTHEVNRLLAVYQDDETPIGMRNQAILEFLYACGARISEASDFQLSWLSGDGDAVRILGKGNKERLVFMHETCQHVLATYLDKGRPALVGNRQSSYVFLSSRGNKMRTEAIRKVFDEALLLAGVDQTLTPHVLRHTFATDLLSGGADLRSVQELLGHASLSTTQVYTHLAPDHLSKVHKQAHPRG